MPPSEVPKQPAPIFLICSERSGSNLISTIMGEHPAIYAHPPYHMGRDLILKLREVGHGRVPPASLEVLVRHASQRVARYRGEEEAARLVEWVNQQAEVGPRSLARFVFQEMPLEAQGKHALVKENNIHHLLFFLVDCFPDAKYLFQVRDPRDYLLSAKLRKRRWLGNKFGSLRNALQIWRDDQVGGLNALSLLGPERVHLHRYEDLVANSEETLSGICEFLGLEFDAAMHDFHAGEGAQRVAGRKGGPRENVAKPLMTSNFRKYRKGLSRGEIRVVEAYVGDLMDCFGYPREFSTVLGPSWYTVMKPQVLEPLQRLVNGEMRPHYKEGNRRLNAELSKVEAPLCPPLWDDSGKDS
jgi:hypothetical protein